MNGVKADLIVVSGRKIAFSNYQVKPNGTYMVLPLQKMLSLGDRRFIIPISSISNFILNSNGKSDIKDPGCKDYVGIGVIAHSICNHVLSEYHVSGREIGALCIPQESFTEQTRFCRSKSYSIESAANAGLHIYDDPAIIYREAFKACGFSNPPFYVGNIDKITETVDCLYNNLELKLIGLLDEKTLIESNIKQNGKVNKELIKITKEIDSIRGLSELMLMRLAKVLQFKEYDSV